MYRRVTFPARMLRLRPLSRSTVGALAAVLLLVLAWPVGAQGSFLGVTGRVIFVKRLSQSG